MKTFDGRFYVCENTNVKCVNPNDGIATNFKVFDKRIYLAGPVMNNSDWQGELSKELIRLNQDDIHATLICNPRREDVYNFEYQICWEQTHLQNCNIIFFYIPLSNNKKIKDMSEKIIYELSEMINTNKYKNPSNNIIIAMHPDHPMYEYFKERRLRMENIEKKNVSFLKKTVFESENTIEQIAKLIMGVE